MVIKKINLVERIFGYLYENVKCHFFKQVEFHRFLPILQPALPQIRPPLPKCGDYRFITMYLSGVVGRNGLSWVGVQSRDANYLLAKKLKLGNFREYLWEDARLTVENWSERPSMSTYENPASGSRSMYATPISLFSRFPSYAYTFGIRRLEFAEMYRITVTVVCDIASRNLELYCSTTYPTWQSRAWLSSKRLE